MNNSIIIKGAREHNLKNIDVTIPRGRIPTGLSVADRMRRTLCTTRGRRL
jgi:excinuclease UvrABC ATPase subunit